ncbi:hypothetical protein ATY35_17865 [Vibrio cidicii]|uniref:Condesin subunit F n=1 Tax=Vibrio cidicii TaxID=1763883 RepID=A0ABR5VZB6_9VIBR|nr:hypothetical protein [Vibrio cidicii]KYN84656.1 hypothetical protein ATY35_17865 [Vibrio cidicii]
MTQSQTLYEGAQATGDAFSETNAKEADTAPSSLNQLLNNLLVSGARLDIDPDQYLYLAAMHAWEREIDDSLNLVQQSFDEETVQAIVRYVDAYAGRNEGHPESRVSNFLKWGVEQRIMTFAGTSIRDENPQYRLTQLAQDLLKPYFKNDNFDQQESLSQRYKRIEVLLSEVNTIDIVEPEAWYEAVHSYLPTLKDLLGGVSKNQELLIAQFSNKQQIIKQQINTSIVDEMSALLNVADELMHQINDLKTIIFTGVDQVIMNLATLQQTAVLRSAPIRLRNSLEEIEVFLEHTSEFANMSLIDLVAFLDRVMQGIRLRLTIDPNANLAHLIDSAIESTKGHSWALALPYQEPCLLMREWSPPPPPADERLPVLEMEKERVVRQNPTHLLVDLANQIAEQALNKHHRVDLADLLSRILKPQDNGFDETDRHRLAVLTLKAITTIAPMPSELTHPGWVPIDEDNHIFIENLWVQGRVPSESDT